MIKNIVFDLGNVLLKDYPSIILKDLEIENEAKQKILETFFSNWDSIDLGTETLQEHWDNCNLNILIDKNIKEKIIHYYKYRPFNEDLINLMKRLKKYNYKIFILSNNNNETYEYLHKLPIFECVDGWVVSCSYQTVKPNKEIYIKLFEKFNIKPEESFFIDDKEENIEIGKKLKMQGFAINNKNRGISELMVELRKNNIII